MIGHLSSTCKWVITSTTTFLLLAVVTIALFSPIVMHLGTAHADTDCRPNGVTLSGSSWLSGGGVNICNNGSSSLDDYGASCVALSGAPGGNGCSAGYVYAAEKWQCVELVNRLYLTKGWTKATWWGNGNKLVNNVPSGLVKQNNGSISYVHPGDVITLDDGGLGHAGIINTIDSNGTLHIKNQNADLNSSAYIESGSLSKGNAKYHMYGWGKYWIQAIVHHPTSAPGWPGVGSATFLGTDHLVPGQTMTSSQYILSGNVQWVLIMQSDGNLVEYHYQSAVWASGTSGHSGAYLGVQGDGNIVIYSSSGQALWATGTNGKNLAYLVIQSDGNFVAYNTSSPPVAIWANNKGGNAVHSFYGSDRLYNGQKMTGDYYLRSADLRYAVIMQADGNLVLFGPGYHVLWANGKNGNPGAYLGLQSDGNIVEYSSSGTALWATNTGGQSLSYLIMQNDGNMVAYATNGAAIWATGTNGKI